MNLKSKFGMVGLDGVEPSTSRLSGVRSNQTELQAPGYFGSRKLDFGFIIFYLFQNPNLKSKTRISLSYPQMLENRT